MAPSYPRRHYCELLPSSVGRFSRAPRNSGRRRGLLLHGALPPFPTTSPQPSPSCARRRHPAAAYLSLKYPLRRRCPPPHPSPRFEGNPSLPCTSTLIPLAPDLPPFLFVSDFSAFSTFRHEQLHTPPSNLESAVAPHISYLQPICVFVLASRYV